MKSFKEFVKSPEEFIGFCHAGGRLRQYNRFDYTESYLHGQGGGKPQEEVQENLNPRTEPKFIRSSGTLIDPEQRNTEVGEEQHQPENLENYPDLHGSGFVVPRFSKEHAKLATRLSSHVDEHNLDYQELMERYTHNSYHLNNELLRHHRNGSKPPEFIKANQDDDEDEEYDSDSPNHPMAIHLSTLDHLIEQHRLQQDTTVYSGMHFHPDEHRGKIAVLPSYMSTSIAPHVAKDFGKDFSRSSHDGNRYQESRVKNILRLHLPKGHPALFADNGSLFPGQGELILPRGMRYQLGQRPTHIIQGKFDNHFRGTAQEPTTQYHIYTGRILPR